MDIPGSCSVSNNVWIWVRIENYCNDYAQRNNQSPFFIADNQSPIVSTKSCFDDLRVPPDHVSRRPTDTYYVDQNRVTMLLFSLIAIKEHSDALFSCRFSEHIPLLTKHTLSHRGRRHSCALEMCTAGTRLTPRITLSSIRSYVFY